MTPSTPLRSSTSRKTTACSDTRRQQELQTPSSKRISKALKSQVLHMSPDLDAQERDKGTPFTALKADSSACKHTDHASSLQPSQSIPETELLTCEDISGGDSWNRATSQAEQVKMVKIASAFGDNNACEFEDSWGCQPSSFHLSGSASLGTMNYANSYLMVSLKIVPIVSTRPSLCPDASSLSLGILLNLSATSALRNF
ncbi:hypothetical protein Bca52824_032975 [Brassica carinata]|uniref:Uncharacterized protein n=1 Tax=Brassica carinata TaxID=52824 RepID=A0A8X7SC07_BRACI|nr:hypothetical protein Bca52824_032975 [Brassica carinata]